MNKAIKVSKEGAVAFPAEEIKKLVWRAWEKTAKKNHLDPRLFSPDKIEIEHPANPDHGDFSTNIALMVFGRLKKRLFSSPLELAKAIKKELVSLSPGGNFLVSKIAIAPPGFVNFWLSRDYLLTLVQAITGGQLKKDLSRLGRGKTMVIDYSAPNIAKPFGIGHLRSTNIGQAIYNLYTSLGWKTIGDNHLGDWGTQFGKLIYQIIRQGKNSPSEIKKLTIKDLEELYVEFHREEEKNPRMEEEARQWFKRLEDGDEEAKKIWQACVDVSLKEFERVYKILGVKIDYAYGESFYHFAGEMDQVLQEAKEKRVLKKSQGAGVIKLPGQKVPAILAKSDGGTIYILRDLAAINFRRKTWSPDVIIYEVGSDQKLHFTQLCAAARIMGYPSHD